MEERSGTSHTTKATSRISCNLMREIIRRVRETHTHTHIHTERERPACKVAVAAARWFGGVLMGGGGIQKVFRGTSFFFFFCESASQAGETQVLTMAKATGIAALCYALTSCQAFLAPVSTPSSALLSGQRGQQQCYSRRPRRTPLSMKEEATAETDKVVEVAVVEGESSVTAAAEGERKGRGKKAGPNKSDLYKNQPKPVCRSTCSGPEVMLLLRPYPVSCRRTGVDDQKLRCVYVRRSDHERD